MSLAYESSQLNIDCRHVFVVMMTCPKCENGVLLSVYSLKPLVMSPKGQREKCCLVRFQNHVYLLLPSLVMLFQTGSDLGP